MLNNGNIQSVTNVQNETKSICVQYRYLSVSPHNNFLFLFEPFRDYTYVMTRYWGTTDHGSGPFGKVHDDSTKYKSRQGPLIKKKK